MLGCTLLEKNLLKKIKDICKIPKAFLIAFIRCSLFKIYSGNMGQISKMNHFLVALHTMKPWESQTWKLRY